MAKSRLETQRQSDARRGVKPIGFKVPIEFADKLTELSKSSGKNKKTIIMEAVSLWEEQQITAPE